MTRGTLALVVVRRAGGPTGMTPARGVWGGGDEASRAPVDDRDRPQGLLFNLSPQEKWHYYIHASEMTYNMND